MKRGQYPDQTILYRIKRSNWVELSDPLYLFHLYLPLLPAAWWLLLKNIFSQTMEVTGSRNPGSSRPSHISLEDQTSLCKHFRHFLYMNLKLLKLHDVDVQCLNVSQMLIENGARYKFRNKYTKAQQKAHNTPSWKF